MPKPPKGMPRSNALPSCTLARLINSVLRNAPVPVQVGADLAT